MQNQNFTYDPTKITDGGLDQMRFELGDTVVDMGGISSAMCDEEYTAIIGKYSSNWKLARMKCLEAIVMKLSYEVNTSVGGLSYSLEQRYERWKKMMEEDRRMLAGIVGVPVAGDPGSLSPCGLTPTPYYHNDMQANIRKF